jgi:hypothetical protein
MNAHQERFLKDELFSLTLMATAQRSGVYRRGLTERERRAFQSALRTDLEEIAQGYTSKVSDESHIKNILKLSAQLSAAHAGVLQGNRFRIGAAQKALNLYLKYLWCIGRIPEPPHCPFDFQIITRLPAYKGPSWTVLDTEADYRDLIKAAKSKAQGSSLAAWELETYNNAQPVAPAERAASGAHPS